MSSRASGAVLDPLRLKRFPLIPSSMQAKTSKVNKVGCILLKILASIYILESFT